MFTIDHDAIDADLANGLGLHMVLIWGRVALVQGIPLALSYNNVLISLTCSILICYYSYVLLIKHRYIPRVNAGTVTVAAFVLMTLLGTVLLWPENIKHMDPVGNTVFYEIIPFIVIGMMSDVNHLYEPMVRASKVTILLCAISSIGIILNGHTTVSEWSSYSMSLSYATLYSVMWLMCDFFKNSRLDTLFRIAIGLAIIILFGSRNPLLSIASYLILAILTSKSINVFLKLFLPGAITSVFICWQSIIIGLNDLVTKYNIKSRTLNLFLNQQLLYDNRTSIHQSIFALLNKQPLGLGIAGDVTQTQEFAHGLYVSVLCTYGYVLGVIVLLLLFGIIIRAYIESHDVSRDILLVYVITVLPRGFTGGDVWSSDVFWWMLAIALCIIHNSSRRRRVAVS